MPLNKKNNNNWAAQRINVQGWKQQLSIVVQVYAAVNACGITLLELSIVTGFIWTKTAMLPRGYIPTHIACADILLLPFSLHILRAVTANPTHSIFARKNNISAKGEMEAWSQDREKGKIGEPR